MCVKGPDIPPKIWSVEDFEDDTLLSTKPDDSCFEAFDYLLAELGQERYIAGQARIHPMPMLGRFEDVRRDVREAMEKGRPGGGFILGPSHSVAYGTEYDNFMAMLDEFVKMR